MVNYLKNYFPLIREREEVIAEINQDRHLRALFESWKKKQQEEFLDFCTGVKGVKILYDSFFKEVMNPEYAPQRLNDFLSVMLKQKVKVLHVLPNDSVRIAEESQLLVTDIVVELENGSIVNVEVQKIGYMFPGERAACYSADLLLRQYKRVRDAAGENKFSYKDVKTVYTIVLFEKSPKEFHSFQENYLHYMEQKADTGLELNLLQKYLFIPLDIFKKTRHNKPIENKEQAWLTFFSTDEPEEITKLIDAYPEFKPMYEDVYELCRNMEKVMDMFSKELQIMDRNTVKYMIDVQQEEIDRQKETIERNKKEIEQNKQELDQQKEEINQQKEEINQQKEEINQQKEEINQQKEEINQQKEEIDQLKKNRKLELIFKVCSKLKKGKSAEIITDELEEEVDTVTQICDVAQQFAPEYDTEKIYDALEKNN